MRTPLLLLALVLPLLACGPPKLATPIADIPKLISLDQVMDNQATVVDPQWKKIGETNYANADFAAFTEVSQRIQATSLKIKDFSKGPEFDALALKLNEHAKTLGVAAAGKDATGASNALKEM